MRSYTGNVHESIQNVTRSISCWPTALLATLPATMRRTKWTRSTNSICGYLDVQTRHDVIRYDAMAISLTNILVPHFCRLSLFHRSFSVVLLIMLFYGSLWLVARNWNITANKEISPQSPRKLYPDASRLPIVSRMVLKGLVITVVKLFYPFTYGERDVLERLKTCGLWTYYDLLFSYSPLQLKANLSGLSQIMLSARFV